jgi:hypothetical protein
MRNETDRDRIMRQGREALKMLDKDKNWTWWRTVGEALITLRHEAMDEALTNTPEGGAYNRAFGRKLREERLEFDKGDRSRLFDVMDHLPAIEAWRATLSLTERRKLNHPSTVWRKWQAATKIPEPRATPAGVDARPSLAALEDEIAQARAHIADLEASRGDAALTLEDHLYGLLTESRGYLRLSSAWNGRLEALAVLPHKELAELAGKLADLAKVAKREATKQKASRSHVPVVAS